VKIRAPSGKGLVVEIARSKQESQYGKVLQIPYESATIPLSVKVINALGEISKSRQIRLRFRKPH
jgi:hypothetical protein